MRIPYSSHPLFHLVLVAGAIASIVKLTMDPGENERMKWFVIFISGMILIRSVYMIIMHKRNKVE